MPSIGVNKITIQSMACKFIIKTNRVITYYASIWRGKFSIALKRDLSLKWVHNEEGKPIFKLDQLAPANGIKHNDAHDALADVRATIAIAKGASWSSLKIGLPSSLCTHFRLKSLFSA
jgi:hypothetical protein